MRSERLGPVGVHRRESAEVMSSAGLLPFSCDVATPRASLGGRSECSSSSESASHGSDCRLVGVLADADVTYHVVPVVQLGHDLVVWSIDVEGTSIFFFFLFFL